MEDGTILAPGRSEFAIGMSSVPSVYEDCRSGDLDRDSLGKSICVDYYGYDDGQQWFWGIDTLSTYNREERRQMFGLTWRLGAFGPFGPFKGLELGLHAEAPNNPVTQELRIAVGLPGPDSVLAHALIAGWGIGAWADNSWFLQYAASRSWNRWRVFGSVRGTLQATSLEDAIKSDRFHHKQTWDFQTTLGGRMTLGEAQVLPDWMLLAVTANLSHAGLPEMAGSKQIPGVGMAFTSGLGWSW